MIKTKNVPKELKKALFHTTVVSKRKRICYNEETPKLVFLLMLSLLMLCIMGNPSHSCQNLDVYLQYACTNNQKKAAGLLA